MKQKTTTIEVAKDGHAIFPPHKAAIWSECPGAIPLITKHVKLIDDKPSPAAIEGTVFHELCASKTHGVFDITRQDEIIPSDKYSSEMLNDADEYIQFLDKLVDALNRSGYTIRSWNVEGKAQFIAFNWGTSDLSIQATKDSTGENIGIVIDIKYGRHYDVDVVENRQLINYALICNELYKKQKIKVDRWALIIYQPRIGECIKRFDIDSKNLAKYGRAYKKAIKESLAIVSNEADPRYVIGDHCTWCPVKTLCPEHTKNIVNTLSVIESRDKPATKNKSATEVSQLSTEQLDMMMTVYSKRKQLDKFIEESQAVLTNLLKQGNEHVAKQFKLVQGSGSREWLPDVEKVSAHLRGLGVKEPTKTVLIGLGEVEAIIGKGEGNGLSAVTSKREGKLQFVPVSDKRPAVISGSLITELN